MLEQPRDSMKSRVLCRFSPFISVVVVCQVLCLERPFPPGFVTSELGALATSWWYCACRAAPPLGQQQEWEEPHLLQRKVKCKGKGVCSVRRAEQREVFIHLTGAVWHVGVAPPLRVWLGFEMMREQDGNFSNRST